MSTWVLGLETSGACIGVALARDGQLVAERSLRRPSSSQERLLAFAKEQLEEQGIRPHDLTRVGVALGPGSFTGLRVGLAAARGLSLGAGVPLVGIPSHEALAAPFQGLARTLVLLSGERRGTVFVEAGRWTAGVWAVALGGACVPVGSVRGLLERAVGASEGAPFLLVGEAVESLVMQEPWLSTAGERPSAHLQDARSPRWIALLASQPHRLEFSGRGLDQLRPLYLRAADARRPGAMHEPSAPGR